MVAEKEKLLQDERKRIKAENERNQENTLAAADIVLQNKLIMEAQQRKEFEIKQVADSLRLEEMHRKVCVCFFGVGVSVCVLCMCAVCV